MNTAEQIRQSCAAAVNYLLEQQDPDGAWRDFQLWVGASGPWLTAVVGRALLEPQSSVSLEKEHPSMVRARAWLHRVEKPRDGGWGFSDATHVDADSTAFVVLFLENWHDLDSARLARLLRTFQTETGGVSCFHGIDTIPEAWKKSHPDVSAVAGLAFDRLGDQTSAEAAKAYCLKFIEDEGPAASHFWKSAVYTPAMTACLLSQTADFRYSSLEKIPHSYVSALETAFSLLLAVHSGAPFSEVVDRVMNAQLADGSWPASCQMSSPTSDRPWAQPYSVGSYTQRFADHKRLFSTALSLLGLSYALERIERE